MYLLGMETGSTPMGFTRFGTVTVNGSDGWISARIVRVL